MKSISRALRSYRQLATSAHNPEFQAQHAISADHILDAQSLHAAIYLGRNYIQESDLGPDRRMHAESDPYQEHSDYFVVTKKTPKGEVVATARQIRPYSNRGHLSFPTIEKLNLYPRLRDEIERVDPSLCAEISGLAKARGVDSVAVLLLYRTMWQYSLTSGHKIWLMGCDADVYSRLKFLFGDALVRIGKNSIYMGSEVVPAMLEVDRSITPLLRESRTLNLAKRIMKRRMVKFMIEGLPPEYLNVMKQPVSAYLALSKDAEAGNS
ncbi:MAG TPA: hypothetical protein VMS08_00500 [Candidatus Saccharimonadia bacterium]|nr:hypothetical protein [Candidatus Saccharimonadia bacterium]